MNVRGFSGGDDQKIAAAYSARAGRPLYFPSGTYNITTLPGTTGDAFVGDGPANTTLRYSGSGTLKQYSNINDITFKDLAFEAAGSGGTLLQMSNVFLFSFNNVWFKGQHNDGTGSTYRGQTGVRLDSNSGDSHFVQCSWRNLGIGIQTACIQNWVTGFAFVRCWKGVWGSSAVAPWNAGLVLNGGVFVGGGGGTSDTHVHFDGPANSLQISNAWFEKSNWAVDVGSAGSGGPWHFGLTQSKIGVGPGGGVRINDCRGAYLAGLTFDPDQGMTSSSKKLSINTQYAGKGTAAGIVATTSPDIARSDFPTGWNVFI